MKVSTIWATGLVCLALGAAIGILAATYLQIGRPSIPSEITYTTPQDAEGAGGPPGGAPDAPGGGPPGAAAGAPGGAPPGGPGGGPPGGPGGGPPGGMGGDSGGMDKMRYPVVLTRLASLIRKLDALTGTPLSVTLSDEQRKVVVEQLSGLDTMETVSTGEAQKRLDALLEILTPHKDVLEAAGFQWPGTAARGPASAQNKFNDEANLKALKSLQERLGGAPSQ